MGALIIKHMNNLSDRETIEQIRENMYMQYFLGYSSYTSEAPFSPSLFVEIRERLNFEFLAEINELIVVNFIREQSTKNEEENQIPPNGSGGGIQNENNFESGDKNTINENDGGQKAATDSIEIKAIENKGRLLMDATVAPQNIAFPTDLNILNDVRKKSEQLIDLLYHASLHGKPKPRTYRKNARRDYLNTVKKKISHGRQYAKQMDNSYDI